MGFPKKSEMLKALKELEGKEGSVSLRPGSSPHEIFRYELCQRFIQFKLKHDLKQEDLARMLRVDETMVSNILRFRVEDLSTDNLIDLYSQLEPEASIRFIG